MAPYIKRHPGQKKSLLKGDAQVAQRLYKIYDLITDIWEKVTNEKAQPFLEFIGGEFGVGYLTPKVEYLHGTDVKAMRQSIVGFEEWVRMRGNDKFFTSQIKEDLLNVIANLDDYEKRYGDHTYGGSYRVRKDEGITYDQLDVSSKRIFDQMRAQNHDEEEWATIAWVIEDRLDDIQR